MFQCSNLMLIESVPGEALSFHVIPFDNPRLQYTLQVTLLLTSTLCTTVNALRLMCACQISPKNVQQNGIVCINYCSFLSKTHIVY